MLEEVESWGLKPAWMTGDSWYSSCNNLKSLKKEELSFLFGVANNCLVSVEKGKEVQVQTLDIPESGLVVYLKEFGWVKLFCQDFKNEVRYYICYSGPIWFVNRESEINGIVKVKKERKNKNEFPKFNQKRKN